MLGIDMMSPIFNPGTAQTKHHSNKWQEPRKSRRKPNPSRESSKNGKKIKSEAVRVVNLSNSQLFVGKLAR